MDVKPITSMISNLPSRYTMNLLDEQVGSPLRNRQHEEFCKAFASEDCGIVQFFEPQLSSTVVQVRRHCLHMLHKLKSTNIETGKWSRTGPTILMVKPASATGGRSWETGKDCIMSINGDHSRWSNSRRTIVMDRRKYASCSRISYRTQVPQLRPECKLFCVEFRFYPAPYSQLYVSGVDLGRKISAKQGKFTQQQQGVTPKYHLSTGRLITLSVAFLASLYFPEMHW